MQLQDLTDQELQKLLWLAQETHDRRYYKAIRAEITRRNKELWLKKNYRNAELTCKTKN